MNDEVFGLLGLPEQLHIIIYRIDIKYIARMSVIYRILTWPGNVSNRAVPCSKIAAPGSS